MKIFALLLLIMTAGFAQLTIEKEIAMGNAVAARMDGRGAALDDSAVSRVMNRIVGRLSQGVALRVPLRLKLITSDEVIALALPGGILVFSSAAIARADNEAELAAEVAHEIAHLQEPLEGPVVFPLCVRDSANLLPLRRLSLVTDGETKADLLAVDYLANAGYEPKALLTLYDRTEKRFVPASEIRVAVGERSLAMTDAVLDTQEFQEIKTRLAAAKPARRTPTLYR